MTLTPITLAEANAFVEQNHRHHGPVVGCKFCIAVADEKGTVRGVAIVGRPVARHEDDGFTLEVNRLCTDGARNACSMLYAASWRAAKATGHQRLITYILESESGASLYASNFKLVGRTKGRSWSCQSRPRVDKYPQQNKLKFAAQ